MNDVILVLTDVLVTVNELELVAVPVGDVTAIVPVVAPEGTVTTSCVVDAELMAAVVPLNFTVSCDEVALKFEPVIVTCVPTGPDIGLNDWMVTWLALYRVTDWMLPTAS